MTYLEEILDLPSHTLAILTKPTIPFNNAFCFVLTNAGTKNRIGPHRLYTVLARKLAEYGFFCIRYDTIGTGDAEEKLTYNSANKFHTDVEHGLFVNDLLVLLKEISSFEYAQNIILGGLCGGSLTSFLAYKQLTETQLKKNIKGFIGFGTPFIYSNTEGGNITMSDVAASHFLKNYLKKLFNLNSWKRFLTGKTSFSLLHSSITSFMKHKINITQSKLPDSFMHSLRDSIKTVIDDEKPFLLIYGEHDILLREYQKYFHEIILAKFTPEERNLHSMFVISNDSHNFFYQKSLNQALDIIHTWSKSINKNL